jgi:hypothetical protein
VGPSSRSSANLKDFNHQDQFIGTVWLAQFVDWRAPHGVPISSKIIVSEFKHALQHQSSRQRLMRYQCVVSARIGLQSATDSSSDCIVTEFKAKSNYSSMQRDQRKLPRGSMHRVQTSGGSVVAPTVGSCLRWKIQLFENLLHTQDLSKIFAKSTREDHPRPSNLCLVHTARRTQVHLHHQVASLALHQLRRTSQLLVTRPHRLYVSLAVRRGYSSLGRSGSTSTTPYTATTSSSGRTTTSTTYLD